jgi:hypothetical protein
MSKLVQTSQYEQITITNTNNISKYIAEFLLKDYSRYCIANQKNVIFGESAIITPNTGSDYNVQINPFFAISFTGKPIFRTDSLLQNISIPGSNPRVDIIQAELGYTDQSQQSRQFIDPLTGNISSSLTYTEFALNATITVKEGSEAASPVAPTVDSGKVKIGEIYVDTTGGIASGDIYNVDSEYGEANTGWTTETAVTTKLIQIQNHRQDTVLDHPNQSVTVDKLNNDVISNLRSFSIPVFELFDSDDLLLHEITVPTGKVLTVFNMGISVENGASAVTNLIIEAGSYSGSFSQLIATNTRNLDFSSSNQFVAGTVVQFKVNNTSGANYSITAHFVYTIKEA